MTKAIFRIGIFFVIMFLLAGLTTAFYTPLNPFFKFYIQGLGQFTGTLFGVISGIAITYYVQHITQLKERTQTISNFIFELEYNKQKIEEWSVEFNNLRNAVNGDALNNYWGYFKFSEFVGVIANKIHTSGEAYNILTKEQFRQLYDAYNFLNPNMEKIVNDEISSARENLITLLKNRNTQEWHTNIKPSFVTKISYWEQKMTTHLNTLKSITESLEKQKS